MAKVLQHIQAGGFLCGPVNRGPEGQGPPEVGEAAGKDRGMSRPGLHLPCSLPSDLGPLLVSLGQAGLPPLTSEPRGHVPQALGRAQGWKVQVHYSASGQRWSGRGSGSSQSQGEPDSH